MNRPRNFDLYSFLGGDVKGRFPHRGISISRFTRIYLCLGSSSLLLCLHVYVHGEVSRKRGELMPRSGESKKATPAAKFKNRFFSPKPPFKRFSNKIIKETSFPPLLRFKFPITKHFILSNG